MPTDTPLILALDTAQEDCAVALVRGGRILAVRSEHVGNRHAECIFRLIDEALADAGVAKRDLSAVAFGAGPGSFTGLRVACGVAQGIAWALKLPVVPVSNLDASALWAKTQANLAAGKNLFVANDARMNECYAALYRAEKEGVERLTDPFLLKPEEVSGWLREKEAALLTGSASGVYPVLSETLPEGVTVSERRGASPEALALLAERAFARGEAVAPARAAPLYVRNRVALTMAERAAGEKL